MPKKNNTSNNTTVAASSLLHCLTIQIDLSMSHLVSRATDL